MLIGVGGMWDDCLSPSHHLLQCSSSEWAVASQKSLSFFSTVCSRSGPSTEWNSQPAQSPTWLPPHLLTFWEMSKDNGKNNTGVMWTSEVAHLAPDLQFCLFFCFLFFTNVNTNIRQYRLHFYPNNYFRCTKKCMVNFLATLHRWLNTLEDTHAMLKVCYCHLLPELVIGGGHQSRTKIRGIIWKVRNVCPDMCFLICLILVITISPESYLAILSHTVYPLGSRLNKSDFGNKRWTLVWHHNVLLQHIFLDSIP